MAEPKISVIIPVYNTENYVDYFRRTMDSVLGQTFSDFELFLVDDGSEDNTVDILQDYKKQDKRIKILKQPQNEGPGNARNLAIKNAKGEYIYNCDSDDQIEKNYLELLYKTAKNTNADLVRSSTKVFEKDGKLFCTVEPSDKYMEKSFLTKEKLLEWCGCHWVALYKAGIIKDNKILFSPNCYYLEDYAFIMLYLFFSDKYVFTNEVSYLRNLRSSSVCHSINVNKRTKSEEISYLYVKKILDNNKDKMKSRLFLDILNEKFSNIVKILGLKQKLRKQKK